MGPESASSVLQIPTYVAPSRISGMGLFAATELEPGTIIWEFTPSVDWRIQPDELKSFPEPYRSRLRHYLYRDDSGAFVLCGDNAKFMNHEDDPNCDDSDQFHTVTRRWIAAGEELTCDYRQFDLDAKTEGVEFASVR